jgi:hypothetical protein
MIGRGVHAAIFFAPPSIPQTARPRRDFRRTEIATAPVSPVFGGIGVAIDAGRAVNLCSRR